MSSSSKKTTVQDMFQGARDAFEQMISNLSGAGLTQATESEVETQTAKQGTDLLRLLIQGHLDLRTAREQLELIPVLKERGDAVRCRLRALETRFGRVSFSRAGVIDSGAAKGTPARFPLDEELNVPPELYSHPLRRCAAAWPPRQAHRRNGGGNDNGLVLVRSRDIESRDPTSKVRQPMT